MRGYINPQQKYVRQGKIAQIQHFQQLQQNAKKAGYTIAPSSPLTQNVSLSKLYPTTNNKSPNLLSELESLVIDNWWIIAIGIVVILIIYFMVIR
jgi:hypothetical protein